MKNVIVTAIDVNNAVNRFLKIQLKILPKINLLLFQSLLIALTLQILQLMRNYVTPYVANRLGLFCLFMKIADGTIDYVILLWASSELRQAVKSTFFRMKISKKTPNATKVLSQNESSKLLKL